MTATAMTHRRCEGECLATSHEREYEELRICRHRGSSRKRRRGHTNQQRRIRFAIFGAPS